MAVNRVLRRSVRWMEIERGELLMQESSNHWAGLLDDSNERWLLRREADNQPPRKEEISRPVERLATDEARQRRENKMEWRQKHYQLVGFRLPDGEVQQYGFTAREVEAMTHAVNILCKQRAASVDGEQEADASAAVVTEDKTTREVKTKARGLQMLVANRMGIGQRTVSSHLSNADAVMQFLADRELPAWWIRSHVGWQLYAPVAGEG